MTYFIVTENACDEENTLKSDEDGWLAALDTKRHGSAVDPNRIRGRPRRESCHRTITQR